MIIDGKKIAHDIIVGLGDTLRGKTLGIVVNGGDPATESFVRIKERVARRLGVVVKKGALEDLIQTCDGVLVQLPHPDADALLPQIPRDKDVDALGANPEVLAPVAGAVREILFQTTQLPRQQGSPLPNIETAAVPHARTRPSEVVVIGEGRLVGKPVAQMLRQEGYEVSVITAERGSLESLKSADLVVSGAGSPHLIKPTILKPGVILIDAGTSEQGGKVVGDCDPACAKVASIFTPVPGGVGPIAIAMLFKNLATLIKGV